MCSHTPARAMGSGPIVGSSEMSSLGALTSAWASSRRRTTPPENVSAGRSAASARPTASIVWATRAARSRRGDVEDAREQRDVLAPGEAAVGGQLLRDAAEQAAHGHRVRHSPAHRSRGRAGGARPSGPPRPGAPVVGRLPVGPAVTGRRGVMARPPPAGCRRVRAARGRRRRAPVCRPRRAPATCARTSTARRSHQHGPAFAPARPGVRTSTARRSRQSRSRASPCGVSGSRADRRSSRPGSRRSSPAAVSWFTRVDTEFPARYSSLAAAKTPMPGVAATRRRSSTWAPRGRGPVTPGRGLPRTRRRTRRWTRDMTEIKDSGNTRNITSADDLSPYAPPHLPGSPPAPQRR